MRKVQQKRILELLQTIKRAQIAGLYADCQEGALAVGEYIESVEGEGTRTVTLLEEYCDELYRVSIGESDVRQLELSFGSVCESVSIDLKPNKIEVLFLPYKRAMSDSLESIWQAARSDPQCDVYIMPIPYYDRLPGGAFGQMQYEGDLYPPDLQVTDWREYDIEARHPDIIFIHYPYDEDNYITSLHPNYYSERLKDFTDLLVYVPYFVCVDDVQEHLCVCAGTLYADRVIVQSEKIRQTYINNFRKFEKENNCRGRFGNATDKFVALGSPKFDAVINSKREDFTLPDEWSKLIGNKKVILYNTTVSAILQGNEQYLNKIRSVLNLFRKRDDVVLWWRPHPLNEATFQSMRPQLMDEYERIVEDYKRDGWGVYDDTAELHRAIAYSDVYYGDRGSLVVLYQCSGKPVMIQSDSTSNRDYDFDNSIIIKRFYIDDRYLWFVPAFQNALMRMDKETWEIEYVGSFPTEMKRLPLYQQCVEIAGRLYFAPFFANEICVYSVKDNVFEEIKYDRSQCRENEYRDFIGAVKYGKYVFFSPYMYPAIMRLNTETGEVDYFNDWVEELNLLTTARLDMCFSFPLSVKGNSFMIASCGANAVIEFNMETLKSTVHKVGDNGYRYYGICFDGEDYWLSPTLRTPIVKWNPEKGIIKEFTEFYSDNDEDCYCFCQVAYHEGYAWFISRYAQHSVKINVSTNVISKADEFPNYCNHKSITQPQNYNMVQIGDGGIYAFCEVDRILIKYEDANRIRKKELRYSPEFIKANRQLLLESYTKYNTLMHAGYQCFYYEDTSAGIRNYLQYILNDSDLIQTKEMSIKQIEIFRSINSNADGTSGQEIYKYCKQI